MKTIAAVAALFGGLTLTALGAGGLIGVIAVPAAPIMLAVGAALLVSGVVVVRRASGDDSPATGVFGQPAFDSGSTIDSSTSWPTVPETSSTEATPDSGPFRNNEDAQSPSRLEDKVWFEIGSGDQEPTARPRNRRTATIARVVAIGLFVAFLNGGWGLFDSLFGSDLSNGDGPNVPGHGLDACNGALAELEGAAASYGRAYSYERLPDGAAEVQFRTRTGLEWDCRWDPTTSQAEVTARRDP